MLEIVLIIVLGMVLTILGLGLALGVMFYLLTYYVYEKTVNKRKSVANK